MKIKMKSKAKLKIKAKTTEHNHYARQQSHHIQINFLSPALRTA
jgi:hypothetical protein